MRKVEYYVLLSFSCEIEAFYIEEYTTSTIFHLEYSEREDEGTSFRLCKM